MAGGARIDSMPLLAHSSRGSNVSRGRPHLAQLLPLLLLLVDASRAAATTVTGLAALHHDGQTFLTWTCPAGTGWTYRVYASSQNIRRTSDLGSATAWGSV